MKADGLILAGGKSRRMGGYHKGDLVYQQQTFLEHVIREFQKEADRVFISYGAKVRRAYEGCKIVAYEFLDCGPMGGIHAGLKACGNEYVMVAACDMPFLEIGLYRYLYGKLREAEEKEGCVFMGAVPVADGRRHPLAAVYKKGMETELERRLKEGRYRLMDALEGQKLLYVDVSEETEFRNMLMNVNTVAEYKALVETDGEQKPDEERKDGTRQEEMSEQRMDEERKDGARRKGTEEQNLQKHHRQGIVAVCGRKNSGKTTLLVRLVEELVRRGVRTAVIKHDGHDFSCDIPGTDSYRFQEAGAYGTAVYSRYRTFIHKAGEPEPEELIRQFPEADLIFIEGMKGSTYPKLEVVRREISDEPVSNPEGRFLLVTDWEAGHFQEPSAGFEELNVIIERIMEQVKNDAANGILV